MRIRAAVLEQFGAPLVVREVELAEPGAGRGAGAARRVRRLPHRPLHRESGADPSGYAPCVLGHEGAGVVERVGEDVTLVAPGDHVVTLFSPQCGECVHCRSPRTNLCLAIREQQNKGYLPDGTTRLSLGDEPLRHFMGTSTFAEYTVMPQIALAKVEPGGAAGWRRAVRLRPLDGARRGAEDRQGRGRLDLRRVRRRDGRARRRRRLPPRGRRADRLRRPVGGATRARARAGRDRHVRRRSRRGRAGLGDDGRLRRRLHVRGDRQRAGDETGGRGGAHGLGPRARWPASPARGRRST